MPINVRNIVLTGTGAGTRVLGPNPKRRCLYIRPASTANVTLKFGEAVANAQDGMFFSGSQPMIVFTRADMGEALSLPLSMLITAAQTCGIMEVTDDNLALSDVTGA